MELVDLVLQRSEEHGHLTVRSDKPWRRFLDSPEITSFMQSYKDLEKRLYRECRKAAGLHRNR